MLQAETVLGCVALSALIDITYLAPPPPPSKLKYNKTKSPQGQVLTPANQIPAVLVTYTEY